jgi:cupin fold WbuC family metalloprotein
VNALPNISGDHFALTEEVLQTGFRMSAASTRRRVILPLHRTQDASVQRMLNFFQPGTYVCPHQHPQSGAIETVHVLAGALGFVLFESDGTTCSTHRLEAGGGGLIDIEPGVWHGIVALAPDTAILEIKQGPYDGSADKTFAPWAPAENDPGAPGYLAKIEALF